MTELVYQIEIGSHIAIDGKTENRAVSHLHWRGCRRDMLHNQAGNPDGPGNNHQQRGSNQCSESQFAYTIWMPHSLFLSAERCIINSIMVRLSLQALCSPFRLMARRDRCPAVWQAIAK